MLLVEILARELGEWPDDVAAITQSVADAEIYSTLLDSPADLSGYINGRVFLGCRHSEGHRYPAVTREMWQAERDKQAAIQVGIDAANTGCLKPLSEVKARYNGPTQWRDRIREIDTQLSDLTIERAERVAELAAEGFALIDVVVVPVEDMEDWRNWRVGDLLVKTVGDNLSDEGYISTITNIDGDQVYSTDECGGESWQTGVDTLTDHRWHSRP